MIGFCICLSTFFFGINLLVKKLIVFLLYFLVFIPQASAQATNVSASVGKYYFSVSGFVSPFASVVMNSNSFFMASTVADAKGNFVINSVLINEGFSDFCLEAIDVKRIGDSYTCFKIDPLMGDGRKENIFLPPTLGLSGKKINPGSSVFASGYTMPYATVKISISKDIEIEIIADKDGFYKYEIKDIPAGKYSLFATANYERKDSEKPSKTKDLESLSAGGVIRENLWIILLIVLIVIAVIILLLILLSRRLREKLKYLFLGKPFGKKKTAVLKHHSWFIGY